MNRQLIILILGLLPIAGISSAAKTSTALPDREKTEEEMLSDSLPPFIIVTGINDPLPKLTDDELWAKGVKVSFKVNRTNISPTDPGYLRLRHALLNIPSKYTFCRLLVLRGSASPEGPADNNKRLAHQRARALTDSLRRYVTLPDSSVEERFINEDYAGLYNLIEKSDFKYKDEVLTEIGYSDEDAAIKRRLQQIDGGRCWKLLLRDYYPKLRATRVVMVISRNPEKVELPVVPVVIPPVTLNPPEVGKIDIKIEAKQPPEEYVFKPWIAIKTNLLYDAVMTPNIEIERWFGKRNQWSVMAEWNFPWWQWHNKERVYEVNEFGLEFRRWLFRGVCPDEQTLVRDPETGKLKPKDPSKHWWLTGHFIAFYLAGGYYDLEWRYHGEQGDIYSAGFTYGYAINLSRHWNMEFSASVGYIHSPYTHYEAEHRDDILFAKYKKYFNYFGPTKLKVSIAWLLGRTRKR